MFFVSLFVLILIVRRPTTSTRSDTLVPYTTLFRSRSNARGGTDSRDLGAERLEILPHIIEYRLLRRRITNRHDRGERYALFGHHFTSASEIVDEEAPVGRRPDPLRKRLRQNFPRAPFQIVLNEPGFNRSAERRSAKECARTFRSRCSPFH